MKIGRLCAIVSGILILSVVLCTCIRDVVMPPGLVDAWDPSSGERGIILIDPGHGGFDGGAVASDGTVEKNINLGISLVLADLLRISGYRIEMTRSDDCTLDETGLTSIRGRKISDMKARLSMYNKSMLVVSVHQNHFSESQYFGTQLLYGGTGEQARDLAVSIQQSVGNLLKQERLREIKKGPKDVYLMHNATVPVVFVECGFLSNPNERNLLKSEEYQKKMAFSIACGMIDYGI